MLILAVAKHAVKISKQTLEVEGREGNAAPKHQNVARGRPKFIINKQQLELYLENYFSISSIAKMISVSERTIKRRLQEFGLSVESTYSSMCNDKKVKALVQENPTASTDRCLAC